MNIKRTISLAAVIIWMVLIFYLSHQPAVQSNKLSTGITEITIETIDRVVPQMNFNMNSLNHVVRKNAHFFAYLVLGVLVKNAFSSSHICVYKRVIAALLICTLYAISDEVHQIFIPGRSGEVMDVLIDSAGAGIGIVLFLLVGKVKSIMRTIVIFIMQTSG